MGSGHSSNTKTEEFNQLARKIQLRRLRKRNVGGEVKIAAYNWRSSPDLEAGDEITRPMQKLGSEGVYIWHHSIYTGDGMVCDRLDPHPPAEISMKEFLDSEAYFKVITYHNDSAAARQDTVRIARMARGQRHWVNTRYNVFDNNCEHFTTFCKTGRGYSRQVTHGRRIVGLAWTISAHVVGRLALPSLTSAYTGGDMLLGESKLAACALKLVAGC